MLVLLLFSAVFLNAQSHGFFSGMVKMQYEEWSSERTFGTSHQYCVESANPTHGSFGGPSSPLFLGYFNPGATVYIGGVCATWCHSACSWSNVNLRYRIYLVGATPGSYNTIPMTTINEPHPFPRPPFCTGPNDLRHRSITTDNSFTTPTSPGQYRLEVYWDGQVGSNTYYHSNSGANFHANFVVMPQSGIFESYAFINLNSSTTFYNMDGANGSTNPNFPSNLGTYTPELEFRLGTEAKTWTRGNHKICEISPWYYFYANLDSEDPIASDFPLPSNGSDFTAIFNGKFRKGTSITTPIETPSTSTSNSVGDSDYDDVWLAGQTKREKYQDDTTSPTTAIILPQCNGTYRIAVAILAKVSTTDDCTDESSLIYYRDINEAQSFLKTSSVTLNLNPKRPANTQSSNQLFYTTRITLGASGGTKTTTDGVTWTPPGPPASDGSNDVVINGDVTISSDIKCHNLTVNPGFTLTIPSGVTVKASNHAYINGNMVIEQGGAFVQGCGSSTPPSNTKVKKSKSSNFNDSTFWSSPISAANITGTLSTTPGTQYFIRKYVSENGSAGGWKNPITELGETNMEVGRAYSAREAQGWPNNAGAPFTSTVHFDGTANNGDIEVDLGNGTGNRAYEYLGNPYPSAIDAIKFMEENPNLESTIYIWRSVGYAGNAGYATYSGSDYLSYNSSGSTPPGFDGTIDSGQGFVIKRNGTGGSALFTNAMRVFATNNQFYSSPTVNRFWLTLRNNTTNQPFNTILIAYPGPPSTVHYNNGYDGALVTTQVNNIATLIGSTRYGIQGRGNFVTTDVVPVSLRFQNVNQTYRIELSHKEGIFDDPTTPVYIKDKTNGTLHNLQNGGFVFEATAAEIDNRFEIVYMNDTLGVEDIVNNASGVDVHVKDGRLWMRSKEEVKSIEVFDMNGRLIRNYPAVNATSFETDFQAPKGAYVLNFHLSNGSKVSGKVIH